MVVFAENVKFLELSGFLKSPNEKKRWYFFLRNVILKGMLSGQIYGIFIGPAMFVYRNWHDMTLVFEAMNNMVSMIFMNLKFFAVLLQSEKIYELVKIMRNIYMNNDSPKDGYRKEITDSILIQTRKLCHFFTTTFTVCIMSVYLPAFLLLLIPAYLSHERFDMKTTQWYPIDVNAPFVYEFAMIYFFVCFSYTTLGLLVIMSLVICFLLHTLAQLKILNLNLCHLRDTAIDNVELALRPTTDIVDSSLLIISPEHSERRQLLSQSVKNALVKQMAGLKAKTKAHLEDVEMKDLLRKYIQQHCEIIKFIRLFEAAFNPVFAVLIVSNLTVTVLIFVSSSVLTDGSTLAMYVPRLVYLLLQLGLYCVIADLVSYQNTKITTSLWKCEWPDCSASFKQSMRIVMSMANKPIVIKTAGFVPLSIDTFSSVMKTAYSYYATLSSFT